MQGNKSPNLIVSLTFEFAIKIIGFSGELNAQKKYVISNQ